MEFTKYEKFYYLLGKLKGKSQLVFSGITPTSDNYETIWNSLVQKYQDKRMLANTFLDQIFELKPIPNPASASQLETFTDKFSAAIAALNELKITDLLDYIFVYLGLRSAGGRHCAIVQIGPQLS